MRELHGIADAEKMQSINAPNYEVSVTDGTELTYLNIGGASYPAGLKPDQARFIARQLTLSAARVEKKRRETKNV